MCKKKQFKYCPSEIDDCIKNLIRHLNVQGITTIASCCGHGRYPLTILIRTNDTGEGYDIVSGTYIVKRKNKFYKKDGDGYYYIPEISKPKKSRRIRG